MEDIRNPYVSLGRYSADLCLFLLVAQKGQLSAAARAAGLSQPRISQRMRALEDSLGRALFLRERRGIALTPDGAELMSALQAPLTEAAEAFEGFRRKPLRDEVVILTDIAFASFLLLPEFPSLNAAFPDIGISVLSQQLSGGHGALDAHITVQMGPVSRKGDPGVLLFRERVAALCSPAFLAANPGMTRASDLLGKPFIDLSARDGAPWFTWGEWLDRAGVIQSGPREVIAFNSYDHVIRAARSGLGVALGWEGLIDMSSVESGLVRAVPTVLESDRGYVMRIQPGRETPHARRVFEWMASAFAAP